MNIILTSMFLSPEALPLSPLGMRLCFLGAAFSLVFAFVLWLNKKEHQARLSDFLISAAISSDETLKKLRLRALHTFQQASAATLSGIVNLFGSERPTFTMAATSAVMSCVSFALSCWRLSRFGLGMNYSLWLDSLPIAFSDHPEPFGNPTFNEGVSIVLIVLGLCLVLARRHIPKSVWWAVTVAYLLLFINLTNDMASTIGGRGTARYIHGDELSNPFYFYALTGIGLGIIVDIALLLLSLRLLRSLSRSEKLWIHSISFAFLFLLADLLWSFFLQSKWTYFDSPMRLCWTIPFVFDMNRLGSYRILYSSVAIASSTNLFFIAMFACMVLMIGALIIVASARTFLPKTLIRLEESEVVPWVLQILLALGVALATSFVTRKAPGLINFSVFLTLLVPKVASLARSK